MSVIVSHLVMVLSLTARDLVCVDMPEHILDVWIENSRLPKVRHFVLPWTYSTSVCRVFMNFADSSALNCLGFSAP